MSIRLNTGKFGTVVIAPDGFPPGWHMTQTRVGEELLGGVGRKASQDAALKLAVRSNTCGSQNNQVL